MSRTTERVHFQGSDDHLLAGILDSHSSSPTGYYIFSHCFTCSKDLKSIVRISRELVTLGWGVLRYDFAGLGNSQGSFSKSNFSTNRMDLKSAWKWMRTRTEAPIVLIGHSFGGAASLSVANELNASGVVTIAAPSDTRHLAELLIRMNPNIESMGNGEVSIGGRTYLITKQMIDDFRSYDFQRILSDLRVPVLSFHSPVDETLAFEHAIRICGYDANSTDRPDRSLVCLAGADHLLNNQVEDCGYIAHVIDRWSRRLIGMNHQG